MTTRRMGYVMATAFGAVITLLSFSSLAIAQVSTTNQATSELERQCAQANDRRSEYCLHLVRRLGADARQVLATGQRLMSRGKLQAAEAVYLASLRQEPDQLKVMKALVRVRAARRRAGVVVIAEAEHHPVIEQSLSNASVGVAPNGANVRRVPAPSVAETVVNQTADAQQGCYEGRWHEALNACQQAIAAAGRSAALMERLGDVYRSVGQPDQAVLAYGESLSLEPGRAQVREKVNALRAAAGAPTLFVNSKVARLRGAPVESTASSQGRQHALVIGNNRYQRFERLLTARDDATLVAKMLTEQFGFEVQTLLDASRVQIVDAISRLRDLAGRNDSVLIYYAGHGILDQRSRRGYWLPVDARRNSIANWISNTDVTDLVAGMQARHVLVVADSCYAGAIMPATAPGRSGQVKDAQSSGRATHRSRAVITSGGLEPVLDNGAGRNSVFAQAFVGALRTRQSVVHAGELFNQLRQTLQRTVRQTPQYANLVNAGHRSGEFAFVPESLR